MRDGDGLMEVFGFDGGLGFDGLVVDGVGGSGCVC
jgi:hypothetical protein